MTVSLVAKLAIVMMGRPLWYVPEGEHEELASRDAVRRTGHGEIEIPGLEQLRRDVLQVQCSQLWQLLLHLFENAVVNIPSFIELGRVLVVLVPNAGGFGFG
jgi:hypothetical protein